MTSAMTQSTNGTMRVFSVEESRDMVAIRPNKLASPVIHATHLGYN